VRTCSSAASPPRAPGSAWSTTSTPHCPEPISTCRPRPTRRKAHPYMEESGLLWSCARTVQLRCERQTALRSLRPTLRRRFMVDLSRRTFVASAAISAGAGTAAGPAARAAGPPTAPSAPQEFTGADPVTVRWLESGVPSALAGGTTWGVPWPKSALPADQEFNLTSAEGDAVPVQTWPLGYWPDGSLKWSAHAVSQATDASESYELEPGTAAEPEQEVTVTENRGRVVVDTGVISVEFRTKGRHVVTSITRDGAVVAKDGRLVGSTQNGLPGESEDAITTKTFESYIESVEVEQEGPVRAVVKVTGTHGRSGSAWLPFTLRFSLFAGTDALRAVHTFIYDGDVQKDFL